MTLALGHARTTVPHRLGRHLVPTPTASRRGVRSGLERLHGSRSRSWWVCSSARPQRAELGQGSPVGRPVDGLLGNDDVVETGHARWFAADDDA